jgi:arylsulfatase
VKKDWIKNSIFVPFVAGCALLLLSCSDEKIVFEENLELADYNIILISIDTLRADHLGVYGYEKNTSPNIDRFAEQSMVFQNAYSPAPATIPALRSMMTGKLISNDNKKEIISYYHNATFLTEVLGNKGYRTVGFTDHRGLGDKEKRSHIFIKGFDDFFNLGKGRDAVTSHVLAEGVLNWLDENHQSKFFLWAHFFDPHFNYNPLPDYEEAMGFSPEDSGRVFGGIDQLKLREIEATLTGQEVEGLVSLHDAEIFYTDKYVGRVLEKLEAMDLLDKTVVVVTGDHGEEFKERTRIGHERTVFNELIRVPLIIRIPGQRPARIEASLSTREIFNILSNLDSIGDLELETENIISRTYHFYKGDRVEPNDFAIISGGYKYVYNSGTGREELYDLRSDVGEKNNLARQMDDKKQRLKEELISWIDENRVEVEDPSQETLEIEEELNERLKALGYVR